MVREIEAILAHWVDDRMTGSTKRRVVRWMDLVAVLVLTITGLGWISEARGWFDPAPYKAVTNVAAYWEGSSGETLIIEADYVKTGDHCSLRLPIVVYGSIISDNREPLEYQPVRGANQSAQRMPGHQHMKLRVDARGLPLESVEVWTRHLCIKGSSEQRVDTMMLEAEVMPAGNMPLRQ